MNHLWIFSSIVYGYFPQHICNLRGKSKRALSLTIKKKKKKGNRNALGLKTRSKETTINSY